MSKAPAQIQTFLKHLTYCFRNPSYVGIWNWIEKSCGWMPGWVSDSEECWIKIGYLKALSFYKVLYMFLHILGRCYLGCIIWIELIMFSIYMFLCHYWHIQSLIAKCHFVIIVGRVGAECSLQLALLFFTAVFLLQLVVHSLFGFTADVFSK